MLYICNVISMPFEYVTNQILFCTLARMIVERFGVMRKLLIGYTEIFVLILKAIPFNPSSPSWFIFRKSAFLHIHRC